MKGIYNKRRSDIDIIIVLSNWAIINIITVILILFGKFFIPEIETLWSYPNAISLLFVNIAYFITIMFVYVDIRHNISQLDRIIQQAISFVSFFVFILFILLNLSYPLAVDNASAWLTVYAVFSLLFIFWIVVLRGLIRRLRKKGYGENKDVIIIGGGIEGAMVFDNLKQYYLGYHVLGYFDSTKEDSSELQLPDYLGSVSDVIKYIEDGQHVDEIYCSISGKDDKDIQKLISVSEERMIRFYIVPEFFKYVKRNFAFRMVNDVPVLSVRHEPLQSLVNRFVKRLFDIVFSVAVLCTLFPVICIVFGTLIKITSPGSIFFKQKRTGINGNTFECYKFRSMKVNTQADKQSAIKSDPRITKVGAFMRKTSLDEFPQFINVLKGEMSVVGPRPHMLKHTKEYAVLVEKFMVRHLVKPGITGWAQVTGSRGELKSLKDVDLRVKKDIWYIENWSFLLDLKIIYKTVTNVFKGEENAY